ncbi:hypothetical protein RUM44_003431 [Polyplax serrata]|uniref:Integral membrane protein 2 n=1 Tax=Polyplax serrata TaxID=468196 RepID=A0ABR1AGG3_POLSC
MFTDTGLYWPEETKVDVESGVKPKFVILGSRAQRVSTATTVCLALTALLVMSFGIIGGMYLYRQFVRSQMHFRGWCTVPYNIHPKAMRHEGLPSDAEFEAISKDYGLQSDVETFDLTNSFKQEFDIDLDEENYEKIMVPDFGRGRKGRFIHDFATNKTGIVDVNGRRCFVMPLNRQRVVPPQSMRDLIIKMRRGYYEVDTEVVRETMRVVMPPITDFTSIGQNIAQECRYLKTYLLEKDEDRDDGISKRSVPTSEAIFTEFAGSKISELTIDTSALDDLERKEAEVV